MAAPPALLALALALLGLGGAGGGDCKGQRRVLRGHQGFVTDGPGNYSVNGNCEWLLEAPSPRHRLLLSFTFMDTECSYDYLFVYDGGSPRAPLLASLSGSALPPPLEATSGKMLLHLFSDANYNLLGFNASFRASLCPRACSGRGGCDPQGTCHCQPGWGGPDCAQPLCHTYCQPHGGSCNPATGRCECRPGAVGRGCDLVLGENRGGGRWYNVSEGDPDFPPRAAAAGAVLPHTGALYVFGGLDLNKALGDLVVYNFTTNRWARLELSPAPAPRHSHVAVGWGETLVLSGGELAGGALADDLWLLEPLGGGWRELPPPDNGTRPPGLAAHAAAMVDDWLYIFGGRTAEDTFSSQLFRRRLPGGGWERVTPWGGKPPAAAGHSMVFHPPTRTLVVYGGHRPSTARFSLRVNTTDLFHVDLRHWTTLRGREGARGPRERAFHSATLIGDYMVVYGGNVHIHYHEEKCYEDEIFFYHLGCHQWVPSAELAHGLPHEAGARGAVGQGRFAHVAAVLRGSVLLVAGGFSGAPRGDLVAYKVPAFVFQVPAQNYHLDYCSLYAQRGTCTKDPQCAWCLGGCQSPAPPSNCPSTGCLGLARLLGDCESCLAFGGAATGPPRAPGPLGWCVQNDTCMPVAEQSRCRVGQISGTYGWWGPRPVFVTSLQRCRTESFLPGLHLLTFQHPRNDSQPDKVSIVRSTTITLSPGGDADVSLVYRGFIYPLLGPPPAPGPGPSVWARIQRLYVVARLARHPDSPELEEVGRWWVPQERETRPLQRPRPERLFGAPQRGNRYLLQVEGRLNASAGGHSSELTLVWDRTGVPGGSEISFFFLEPFRAPPGRCPLYPSCLACLGDQGCGWCPPSASCHSRLQPPPPGGPCGGAGPRLVLAPANCPLCEDHRDCPACAADPFCEWQVHSSKKGDFVCSRRGRQEGAVRAPQDCPSLCSQRRSCSECLSNSSQCAWCQSTRSCFFFAAYLAKYPFGGCRGWYDSVHSAPQCLECPRFPSCRECLRHLECGWCGDADNPTLGRCLEGDFSGVRGFPNCSVALGGPGGLPPGRAAAWSYGECPDVDECRLGLARCHPRARCHNTPQAFACRCRRGYAGDGTSHCNRTCYDDCGHGECSGAPDYTCRCHLGWTSAPPNASDPGGASPGDPPAPPTPPPDGDDDDDGAPPPPQRPPAALCSVDCGCHFHSSCQAGPGHCDRCQDWTEGERCELCRPGSFGDATGPGGCQPCQCHGHGQPERGHCHRATGHCFCTPPTEGPHCERCAPGYFGDPRDGGTCYRECGGRSLVANLSSLVANLSSPLALGSRLAGGAPAGGGGLSYCVWVLSVTGGLQPCPPGEPCPPISLSLQPAPPAACTNSFTYAFDGVPAFLDSGVLGGDPTLMGAFCGGGPPEPLTLYARSGVLVLYHEANGSAASGFNASVGVSGCDPPCPGGGHQCPGGGCPPTPCPGGCGTHGTCDTARGRCRCSQGYGGPNCSEPLGPGTIVWESLDEGPPDTAGRFLRRLGHSLVPGPEETLWMFGGLSLSQGPLDSVYRYSIPERRWTQMLAGGEDGGPGPAPRYFHAAAPLPPPRRAMLVVGGLTPGGAAADAWILNLTTLQWRQLQEPLLPAVAGHTLTPRGGRWVLLIGGFSPQNGFNTKLLLFRVETESWEVGQQAGTPPTGLYGHSAVYHEPSDAVFVFGGQRFHVEAVGASPELYSLHCPNLTWSLLAPARGGKPQPHFFHAAAALGDVMVVVGGRTPTHDFSRELLLYQLRCNAWLRPPPDAEVGERMEGSVAHAVAVAGGRLFVSGGFNGAALGGLRGLRVPEDPCGTLPGPQPCQRAGGACAWCRGGCVHAEAAQRLGCDPGPAACAPSPRTPQDCRRLRSCSECLAQHPRALGGDAPPPQLCTWCTNCPEGACIARGRSCARENDCRVNQRAIAAAANCSEAACGAADCGACTAGGGCMWTRQFKRTGETRRILSVQPSYDWTCFSHSLLNVSPMPVESSPPLPCPTPCHRLGSCPTCLASKGADGGWQHCFWSLGLQQCLSPSWVPLRCLAGGCGRLLRGPEGCAPPCAAAPQCSQCLRLPHCGWCARRGTNGGGRCMEGGLHGPRHGLGQTCGAEGLWAFLSCPPEDECANGHHHCDGSQECQDLPHGYRCACRRGYRPHNATGPCRPVCERGCVNGWCVEPNRCRCHFGFVGQNCSVACDCNGHGQCRGPTARDQCLQCFNNTQGPQCERCRPLFVGSARAGGSCRSCRSFCRHNAAVCLSRQELERARRDPARFPLDPAMIPTWVSEGPSEEAAVCVNCQNNSVGERCDGCRPGFFLLDGACTRCQCNGHADTCNELDGTGCPCQNNTESGGCPASPPDRRDCYKHQCSKCRDSFHGHPVGGQQCYRLMAVEQEYCLDPSSQSNCFHQPQLQHLPPGRTVLFGVQPKFTNVDIRITLDLTFGAVDLFVSTAYDTFAVDVDPATGRHLVRLQTPPGGAVTGGTGSANGTRLREERARGLVTYLTVREAAAAAALVVRGVRDRLVLTYPHALHPLKSSRFYLLLLGAGGGPSQGLLFFRQDQAHIDLFVFFSVFFSCFFLFLALCVLLWKAKQGLDARHEQRRHLQEMTKMASRPFARVTVCFQPGPPAIGTATGTAPRGVPPPPHRRHPPPPPPPPAPVTLEPTEDGVAAVATLLLQLPGGGPRGGPHRAALASALVTLRQGLQEFGGGGGGGPHPPAAARKGGLGHEMTSMAL